MNRLVLTFSNETQVLRFESILKKNNINCKLIPIPRDISSGCGIAIQTDINNKLMIEEIIKNNQLTVNGIYDNV